MKKEQLALREQALLTAALNCFSSEGCENVTVARIARLAGVAKGTVYLHFKSKDEICARLAQNFYDALDQKYEQISGDGSSQLKQIIEISFHHYREMKHYRHIVQYCHREHFLQHIGADISKSLQDCGISRRQSIARALNLGANDRSLASDARSKLTGTCCAIDGALFGFRAHFNSEPHVSLEFIDTITRYILSSVGNDNPVASSKESHTPTAELIPEV